MTIHFKRRQILGGIGQNHFIFVQKAESFCHLLQMMLNLTFPEVLHIQKQEQMAWRLAVWSSSPGRGRGKDSKIREGRDLFDTSLLSDEQYLKLTSSENRQDQHLSSLYCTSQF